MTIRAIQAGLRKILHNPRLGQALKGYHKIDNLSPLGWQYLREKLLEINGVVLTERFGTRTVRSVQTSLRKASVKGKILIEKIVITGNGVNDVKPILGRYCIVGTRKRWPKAGEILSSTVGTNVNIIRPENELSFEYISA